MSIGAVNSPAAPEVSFLPSRTNPSEKVQPQPTAPNDGGMMPNCPHMGGAAGSTGSADLGPSVGQHLNVKA